MVSEDVVPILLDSRCPPGNPRSLPALPAGSLEHHRNDCCRKKILGFIHNPYLQPSSFKLHSYLSTKNSIVPWLRSSQTAFSICIPQTLTTNSTTSFIFWLSFRMATHHIDLDRFLKRLRGCRSVHGIVSLGFAEQNCICSLSRREAKKDMFAPNLSSDLCPLPPTVCRSAQKSACCYEYTVVDHVNIDIVPNDE